jgi:cell wall-associated NlpC family hydrolase
MTPVPNVDAPTSEPVGPIDSRRADGVLPTDSNTDEYLVVSEQRDVSVARLNLALAALVTTRAAVEESLGRRAHAAVVADDAHVEASVRRDEVGDVARQMYQQGDGGLVAVASALTEGPEGFLDRLDNVRAASRAARAILGDSMRARDVAALADAQLATAELRVATLRAREADDATRVQVARTELAGVDGRLSALTIAAPQLAIGPQGCPRTDVPATLRDGSDRIGAARLCRAAVHQAATPQAALAITWAFQHLGATYACGGSGRLLPFRMDCSSFVSRAYHEGAGLRTAGVGWAPSTRDMVPWDGVTLNRHYAYVAPAALRPGDLVLYDTCPQGGCPYKHVVMYLGSPDGGKTFWMAHTNACGDIAKVETFWGFPASGHPFLVARRVLALPGERVTGHVPAATSRTLTP